MISYTEVVNNLKKVLGTKKDHTYHYLYRNGMSGTKIIPDDKLEAEVKYDFEARFGRAIFVDKVFIYNGYYSIDECKKIEKTLSIT